MKPKCVKRGPKPRQCAQYEYVFALPAWAQVSKDPCGTVGTHCYLSVPLHKLCVCPPTHGEKHRSSWNQDQECDNDDGHGEGYQCVIISQDRATRGRSR